VELAARTTAMTQSSDDAVLILFRVDLPSPATISRPVVLRSRCHTLLQCGCISIRSKNVTLDGFNIVGSLELSGVDCATVLGLNIRSSAEP
jgi:hypothetical protein